MSKTTCIYTYAHLPSNHKFNWDGPRPTSPLIGVGNSHIARPDRPGWIESPRIEDLEDSQELKPGLIFLIVFCHGYWWSDWTASAHWGGCSWYVSQAFLKEENAKAYVEAHQSRERYEYYWVVPSTLLP